MNKIRFLLNFFYSLLSAKRSLGPELLTSRVSSRLDEIRRTKLKSPTER